MANRMISKIKNLSVKCVADSSVPKGIPAIEFHDEDIEEVCKSDENEILKAEYMSKAGKSAVAAAVIESAYKAASLVEIANQEGLEEAEKRWRSKIGVSGSDNSYKDVEDTLYATLDILDHQGGGGGAGGGKSGGSISNDEGSVSDGE